MRDIPQESIKAFEEYVDTIIQKQKPTGMLISVFDKTGTTVYEKFHGYKNAEQKTKIDKDTIFGLASITKSFTCLSIMQLVEKGVIDLYAPVSDYIPEFKSKSRDVIRVLHLMTHSAGFFPLERILVEPVAESLGLVESDENDFAYSEELAQEGAKLVVERLNAQTKHTGAPGQNMSYSNDSYALLSDIVYRYGGEKSYAAYVKKHIIEPLAMDRSGCDFLKYAKDDNVATLYKKEEGALEASLDFHDNAFVLMGGGAMKSTLSDMKKYVTMYLNKGEAVSGGRVLSAANIEEMCKPKQPYLYQQFYGYGLSSEFFGDMTAVGHGGSLTGISSNMLWSYDANIAVLVLCNTSDISVSLIANAALRTFHGLAPEPNREGFMPLVWPENLIEKVCGKYSSGEETSFEISRKEGKTLILKTKEKEDVLLLVSEEGAIIRGEFSDVFLKLYFDGAGKIPCVGYGSRMIPKL